MKRLSSLSRPLMATLLFAATWSAVAPSADAATCSVYGRDNWVAPGRSRLLRVNASGFTSGPFALPQVSNSLVTPLFVEGGPSDFTVSVSVGIGATAGPVSLTLSNTGGQECTISNALYVVDREVTIAPNVYTGGSAFGGIAPGITAKVVFPSIAGLTWTVDGSTAFDFGPDVVAVPTPSIASVNGGSLEVYVSVAASAMPGTRSIHIITGGQSILIERGLFVDHGPLTNPRPDSSPTVSSACSPALDLRLPASYTVSLFLHDGDGGPCSSLLRSPDHIHIDERNRIYVSNQGAANAPPAVSSVPPFTRPTYDYSVSVFQLAPPAMPDAANPDLPTATLVKQIQRPLIDVAGRYGILEGGTTVPGHPDKLFVATEDFPEMWDAPEWEPKNYNFDQYVTYQGSTIRCVASPPTQCTPSAPAWELVAAAWQPSTLLYGKWTLVMRTPADPTKKSVYRCIHDGGCTQDPASPPANAPNEWMPGGGFPGGKTIYAIDVAANPTVTWQVLDPADNFGNLDPLAIDAEGRLVGPVSNASASSSSTPVAGLLRFETKTWAGSYPPGPVRTACTFPNNALPLMDGIQLDPLTGLLVTTGPGRFGPNQPPSGLYTVDPATCSVARRATGLGVTPQASRTVRGGRDVRKLRWHVRQLALHHQRTGRRTLFAGTLRSRGGGRGGLRRHRRAGHGGAVHDGRSGRPQHAEPRW